MYSRSRNGRNWEQPRLLANADSTAFCSACGWGVQEEENLPDGRAFTVGNPQPGKDRRVLSIAFSNDGKEFGEWITLRDSTELADQSYPGRYKTKGYSYPKAIVRDSRIYISYSENKERIMISVFKYQAI